MDFTQVLGKIQFIRLDADWGLRRYPRFEGFDRDESSVQFLFLFYAFTGEFAFGIAYSVSYARS